MIHVGFGGLRRLELTLASFFLIFGGFGWDFDDFSEFWRVLFGWAVVVG